MRELKFRAWNGSRMTPVRAINLNYDYYENNHSFVADIKDIEKSPLIMQYTGLKDKNGKEIYEGDIIKIDEVLYKKNFITDVYFEFGAFRYRHSDGSGSVMDFKSTTKIKGYEKITHDIEVIGNIYANPELLGDKK